MQHVPLKIKVKKIFKQNQMPNTHTKKPQQTNKKRTKPDKHRLMNKQSYNNLTEHIFHR